LLQRHYRIQHWQSIHERIRATFSRTWYTRSCCSRPCLVSL
jgi:hypothetical protein